VARRLPIRANLLFDDQPEERDAVRTPIDVMPRMTRSPMLRSATLNISTLTPFTVTRCMPPNGTTAIEIKRASERNDRSDNERVGVRRQSA